MLIGFNAPVAGPLVETRTGAEGEAMGFGYLAFNDHIACSARSGVDHIEFGFGRSSTDQMLTMMERFRDEVLARV